MHPNRQKNLIVMGLATMFAFCLSVVSVETYLRCSSSYVVNQNPKHGDVYDFRALIEYTPLKGNRLIPNSHVAIRNHPAAQGQDIIIDINSLGFRGKEIPKQKKKNEKRILFLGDSITFGDYLQEDELYIRIVEKNLNGARQTSSFNAINFNVINGAVWDLGIREELAILIDKGLSVQPNIVVLPFYLNDSRPPWGFAGDSDSFGILRRHSVFAQRIYRYFRLSRWAKKTGDERFAWVQKQNNLNWAQDRNDFLKLASMAKYDWGAAWEPNSWSIVSDQLDKLKSLSDKHKFNVIVLIFPVFHQIYSKYIEDTPQRTLKKMAYERGFPYFDLIPVLRKNSSGKLFLDQCHLTQEGNRVAGAAIADFIRACPFWPRSNQITSAL